MNDTRAVVPGEMTVVQGRLCIAAAAVLWSTSGFFSKVLTQPVGFGVDEPHLAPMQIAFFRVLFAGLFLLPLLRPAQVVVRPAMLGMALSFAAMNATFISAQVLGKAANAILLQYTAPLWIYLFCVGVLREPADRRNTVALIFGLAGVAVILAGGWAGEDLAVLGLGLASGVTYASIVLFLRVLRSEASTWLTVWNHLTAALLLAPFGLIVKWDPLTLGVPTWPQIGVLFVYGALQMGFPYFLMARGLRVVSPQEAGALTLVEPVLNPLWAFLVSPETETPGPATLAGGALILAGLAWRYRPQRGGNSSAGAK
jgi:drug/metabolite transporter (DMT)-like permease